jgi:S1-C subfamily serine protease
MTTEASATPTTPAPPASGGPEAAPGGAGAPDAAGVLAAFSDQLAAAVERAGASVVRVEARRRQPASGLVWDASGLILTADHVLEREEDLAVGLPDGRTVEAKIAGRDPGTDLALLRVEAQGLTPMAHGPAPRVGHLALVVARPGTALATSIGVVSAIGGPVRTWRGGRLDSFIQTDATLYPGFSGGALVDLSGRLLGVATSQFRWAAGLVIPLETARRAAAAIARHGRIARGYLGVSSQQVPLPEALAQRLGLTQESALLIVGVESGAPADRAGLMIGDVLVALAGQPVRSTEDLLALLGPERVGQDTPLRVIRGGESRDITVKVGERG